MITKNNLKIDYVDITHLKPYERNAKIHTKKQIAKIIQSMKAFGVVTPILTNKAYEVILLMVVLIATIMTLTIYTKNCSMISKEKIQTGVNSKCF